MSHLVDELSIAEMDALLCMLHLGGTPGGKKLRTGEITEQQYGPSKGREVQGRRTATRNTLNRLSGKNLIRMMDVHGALLWQITENGMVRLHPPTSGR